jgi:hypothetical protein
MSRKNVGLAAGVFTIIAVIAGATAVFTTLLPAFGPPPFEDHQGSPQAGRPAGPPAAAPVARQNLPPDFMGVAGISGWVPAGTSRAFTKDSLYGYVDGGAEIFLEYGFRNLWVFEFVPDKPAAGGKEITLELYQMSSPAAAFGIFSTRREGNEPVSASIKTANWIGREQTNFVKGDLYANILAADCTQDEVEAFAMSLDLHLPAGEALLPRAFFCMPEFNLIRGSERYICGTAAATNESPLLGADFWGFKEGLAEAYSVKYGPGDSKLVLIHFKKPPKNLVNNVLGLFNEYLMDVTTTYQVMQGRTVAGRKFYFGWNGPNGIIITDEPDPKAARMRIEATLKKAAERLGTSEEELGQKIR